MVANTRSVAREGVRCDGIGLAMKFLIETNMCLVNTVDGSGVMLQAATRTVQPPVRGVALLCRTQRVHPMRQNSPADYWSDYVDALKGETAPHPHVAYCTSSGAQQRVGLTLGSGTRVPSPFGRSSPCPWTTRDSCRMGTYSFRPRPRLRSPGRSCGRMADCTRLAKSFH